ncbi:hypothetical protein NOF04DRAFT_1418180 [Fusarium oxysporum II5]|nr:hypothetical protein NOF04DRAFT_1418180 [Fusarium oxysporum II5]
MAQTPSSPLIAATAAAATEGAERTNPPLIFEQQPISIIESANELARERVEEYNAKLMVFQAFCAKFEEAAQQFTNGPQRRFAQQFADSFLDSWKRELSGDMPTSKPTYSSVAASHPSDRARPAQQHQQQQRRRSDPPHRQGQQTTVAPPRQDLRVFVRLEAGAPARDHSSYAIRTLIQEKLGTVSDKIRQVFLRELATQNIYICLDNLQLPHVFLEFQALATSHGAIQVRWYQGTPTSWRNEQADKLAKRSSLPEPEQPISIIESANELARERVEEYNAKLMVFQAFCAKFEEAAQQFTNGPQRRFAQQFADSFLDSWKRELSGDMPTSKPTYSSVAASHPSDRARPAQQHQQQQRRRSDPPHRQGQQTTVAPPDKTSASSSV